MNPKQNCFGRYVSSQYSGKYSRNWSQVVYGKHSRGKDLHLIGSMDSGRGNLKTWYWNSARSSATPTASSSITLQITYVKLIGLYGEVGKSVSNELEEADCEAIAYVDDLVDVVYGNSRQQLQERDRIEAWCSRNKLKLSDSKTEML